MSSPELYHTYARTEVLALLGERDAEFVEDHHGFFVAGDVALCLVKLTQGRGRPSFPDRSSFYWPQDCSPEILERRLPVRLFIEQQPDTFLYVGVTHVASYGSGSVTESETRFYLSPALPRELWLGFSELTRGSVGPLPPAEVEIARLAANATTAERMRALESFLAEWYGPSARTLIEAVPDVPSPLLEFHRRIAGLPKVVTFNELVPLNELVVKRGRLLFYVENQGVCLWSTEPSDDDPPVWWRLNESGKKWLREDEPLSGFLIQLALFEAIGHSPFGASAANLETAKLEALRRQMTPLPLGGWRWPTDGGAGRSRFYARNGALMFCGPNGDHHSVYVGAKDPHALSFLEESIDESWEYVAF